MRRHLLPLPFIAAICFACPPLTVRAQSQTAAPPTPGASAPSQQPPTPAKVKPAKVWSNDDVGQLETRGISTVGNNPGLSKQRASSPRNQTGDSSSGKPASWYRQQLAPLRAEAARLDSQIQTTKSAVSGKDVSGPQPFYHTPASSPADQLKQLEARRQANQSKIDDLLDRARRAGITATSLE